MRKQRTKFTDSQIELIYNGIEEGKSMTLIAKELNVYPQIIQTFCKNNDLKSKQCENKWSLEEDELLKSVYVSSDFTMEDIMDKLKRTKDSVQCRAKELKIKRPYMLTDVEKKFIDDNYSIKTIQSIATSLKRKRDTIVAYMKSKNYESMESKLDRYLKNEDFSKDFCNPQLSGAYVARKHGFNDSYITLQRKKRIGSFKQMTNTFLCKSVAEMDFEDILEELNMSYFYEHKIDKWKVDYYLGFNVIVEIQGAYWHSLEKVKEKDSRKFKELKDLGYTVIEIQEEELKNKESVKETIVKTFKGAVLG